MRTYSLTFRNEEKGYSAHAKVRAETEADAVRILRQRKPYATSVGINETINGEPVWRPASSQ